MKPVPSLAGLVIGLPPLQIKCSGEEETGTPQLGHQDAWAGQGLVLYSSSLPLACSSGLAQTAKEITHGHEEKADRGPKLVTS